MGKGAGAWGDIGSYSFQQSRPSPQESRNLHHKQSGYLGGKTLQVKHIGYSRYDKQGQAGTPPPQGLECHNFRGLAMTAKILSNRSRDSMNSWNDTTNSRKSSRKESLTSGVESGTREDWRQGKDTMPSAIFDGPEWDNIPTGKIQAALAAEGAPTGRTYGPVYSHMLFNLTPDQYVMPKGGCPVAEHVHDRTFNMLHWKMYEKNNAELLLKAIGKSPTTRKNSKHKQDIG